MPTRPHHDSTGRKTKNDIPQDLQDIIDGFDMDMDEDEGAASGGTVAAGSTDNLAEYMQSVMNINEDTGYLTVKVLDIYDKMKEGEDLDSTHADTIREYINSIHTRFVELGEQCNDFTTYMKFVQTNFDLDGKQPEDLDVEEVDRKVGSIMSPILAIGEIIETEYHHDQALYTLMDQKLSRVMCVVNSMKEMLLYTRSTRLQSTCGITDLGSFGKNYGIIKLLNTISTESTEMDVVRFAIHTLQQLQLKQYQRLGDRCYKQRVLHKVWENGCLVDYDEDLHSLDDRVIVHTRSWEDVCSIDEFVRQKATNKLEYPEMWKIALQRPQILPTIKKDLMEGVHHEFKELKINQCMFAFRNGIYHTEKQKFYPWRDADGVTESTQLQADSVPLNDACINYFDVDCNTSLNVLKYMDIPTPTLDRILDFQLEKELAPNGESAEGLTGKELAAFIRKRDEVKSWVYCHLGRLFFPLHKHDYWQIVFYIYGMAGTGKSTLGELYYDIFPEEHIGLVNSNIEKQFGLQTLYDKPLWVSLEVKEDFKLNLADLQSMISGERVQVAIKNQPARMVKWKSPGMMAGNVVPPWEDKAGALGRRFVLLHFNRIIPNEEKDASIKTMLRKELGNIIPKLSRAYMVRTTELGMKRSLWAAMPDVFNKWSELFKQHVDLVNYFVSKSGKVRIDPNGYVLESQFVEEFRNYIKEYKPSAKNVTWTPDTYQNFFQSKNIRIFDRSAQWNDVLKKSRFIKGVVHVDYPDHSVDTWDDGVEEGGVIM